MQSDKRDLKAISWSAALTRLGVRQLTRPSAASLSFGRCSLIFRTLLFLQSFGLGRGVVRTGGRALAQRETLLKRDVLVISMKLGGEEKKGDFSNLGQFGRRLQRFASNFSTASKGAAASFPVYRSDLSYSTQESCCSVWAKLVKVSTFRKISNILQPDEDVVQCF